MHKEKLFTNYPSPELLLFLDISLILCFIRPLERDVGRCNSVGNVQASQAWGVSSNFVARSSASKFFC